MTNQAEDDYDRKFQEDLEKATALSLETLALEKFKRSKLQYSYSDASNFTSQQQHEQYETHNNSSNNSTYYGGSQRSRPGSFRSETGGNKYNDPQIPIPPPPAVPPRRHSEVHYLDKTHRRNQNENKDSISSSDTNVDDLISFTSPTSNKKEQNINFESLLEEIQRLNTQNHVIQPYNPVTYGSTPSLNSNDMLPSHQQSLQLVPYSNQQDENQKKSTLTNEELNKLYSMQPQLPFRQPYQITHPYLQTTMATPPISMQQQQQHSQLFNYPQSLPPPAPSYGFQMHIFPSQSNQIKLSTPPPSSSSSTIGFNFSQTNQQSTQQLIQQKQLSLLSSSSSSLPSGTANSQITKSASITAGMSLISSSPSPSVSGYSNNSSSGIDLKTNEVVRRSKKIITSPSGNGDLIDWGQEDNSRVSVLEAFDPLLSKDWDETGDNSSDCTTSYYAEYDPFDYLYSCSTQYSDSIYEVVNKADRTPITPNAPIGWNLSTLGSAKTSTAIATSLLLQQPTSEQQHQQGPPPLPPRNNSLTGLPSNLIDNNTSLYQSNNLDRRKYTNRLYENVIDRKTHEPELMEFYKMVKDLRSNYKCNDEKTNVGHLIASEFTNNDFCDGKSIKILVYPSLEILRDKDNTTLSSSGASSTSSLGGKQDLQIIPSFGSPITFTCDIETTVEHVIMQVYCALEGQIIGTVTDFVLKPIGVMEWLSPSSKLSQLVCVHDSIKLEHDIQLGLCLKSEINMKAFARTAQDDVREVDLKPEDILPNEHESTITFDNMMILIETLETEIDKLEISASDSSSHSILSCSGVVQGVKAICALLGSIDTLEIVNCVDELKKICVSGQIIYSYDTIGSSVNSHNPDIVSECGDYAEVTLRPKSTLEQIKLKCNQIREAIQGLIETYANAFRVDFCVKNIEYTTAPISISYVLKPVIVNISCLHRPPPNWKYDGYMLGAQIYHGTRFIGDLVVTQCSNEVNGELFPRLKFDTWITFDKSPLICSLPRESRLIFVLYGCTTEPAEVSDQTNNDSNTERKQINTELGWAAIQLFDFQRQMICGSYLLSLWPPTTEKILGPAPAKGCHPHPDFCPVLSIEIPNYGGYIIFPESNVNLPVAPRYDFNSLDYNLQEELLDTAEQGYIMSLDKREVFWEKRHYLQSFPHALPKVLHAAHSWDCASLQDLHSLLKSWTPLSPLQALELLLPQYPDIEVRSKAAEWISKMANDQLVDYLPQLLQALKHDTYEASSMARFLLSKCLESPRIAHHLYWLLVHSLPGESPQNSIDSSNGSAGINIVGVAGGSSENDETLITQARYHRRNKMMLRSLLAICGEKLLSRFLSQNMMCKNLAEIAQAVKQSKESLRQTTLIQGMETVNQILLDTPTSLPLGLGYEVCGVNSRGCSYFNSYTLPLKIAFFGPDRGILPAIFKCGDDLQQDMLTIQLVRIMDKLWLAEGLDLKMVTFNCVPTGHKKGMIELITEAETLRKIQVEYGLTGSFKDRPIAEWLAKKNPSQLEYQRAVDNFTVSCAGYSVATYILGICDRHNDNIMLKTSGHLFHIDFGKFLGDAQMFGNFKRDRTPFVLTSDMAYVINGGDKPSTKFHHFVDLCCRAFNIVRNHGDLLLHMLALMATAGIPGVTAEAVTYVRKALLPSQSNPEAAASFAKMIQFSLKSWFTQFNFFLHNLAQLRFSNDDGNGELLSFVPRTYTMQQDGRLKSVTVHGYQKRYDLEKYYTYILKVTRQSQPDPAYLFRAYKEFQEFHQKLCLHFPLAKLHSLPSGSGLGRSNIKTVAERRLPEIRQFLISLFDSADEIAHSDLVYTFFHPLLRDQQEANIHVSKVKEIKLKHKTENVCGEIKLSLQYRRGALTVMIHHARGLPVLAGGQEPNTYVKTYLKPDTMKATKRKTKVVRKTCVPSFMETLEYRMPIEYIQNRILQVTVWSHDTLQENELLGGFELPLSQYDLREELCQWFRLGYLPRS